jgi:hypothetical protein
MVLLILLLKMVSEYTITLEPTNKTLSQKVLASCQISGYDILVEFGGHFSFAPLYAGHMSNLLIIKFKCFMNNRKTSWQILRSRITNSRRVKNCKNLSQDLKHCVCKSAYQAYTLVRCIPEKTQMCKYTTTDKIRPTSGLPCAGPYSANARDLGCYQYKTLIIFKREKTQRPFLVDCRWVRNWAQSKAIVFR